MIRAFSTGVVVLLCCSAAHAADCHIDPYNFTWGSDTSTHMTVKSGHACGSTIGHGNGSGARQTDISQPAANGTADAPSANSWKYVARKGFTGKDSFVVATTGESMGSKTGRVFSGTTHISVDVDVVP